MKHKHNHDLLKKNYLFRSLFFLYFSFSRCCVCLCSSQCRYRCCGCFLRCVIGKVANVGMIVTEASVAATMNHNRKQIVDRIARLVNRANLNICVEISTLAPHAQKVMVFISAAVSVGVRVCAWEWWVAIIHLTFGSSG